MLAARDNLVQLLQRLARAQSCAPRSTMLGLTMGVATLITVMTIVQGANVYVEQKIAKSRHQCLSDRAHSLRSDPISTSSSRR